MRRKVGSKGLRLATFDPDAHGSGRRCAGLGKGNRPIKILETAGASVHDAHRLGAQSSLSAMKV